VQLATHGVGEAEGAGFVAHEPSLRRAGGAWGGIRRERLRRKRMPRRPRSAGRPAPAAFSRLVGYGAKVPEGDTVYLTARQQHDALTGRVLTASDFRVPAFATVDLTGETVREVVSCGKHLLHRIGDWTVHSHLKMEGAWRIFRGGERWTRPAHQARAVLTVEGVQSVGFEL